MEILQDKREAPLAKVGLPRFADRTSRRICPDAL